MLLGAPLCRHRLRPGFQFFWVYSQKGSCRNTWQFYFELFEDLPCCFVASGSEWKLFLKWVFLCKAKLWESFRVRTNFLVQGRNQGYIFCILRAWSLTDIRSYGFHISAKKKKRNFSDLTRSQQRVLQQSPCRHFTAACCCSVTKLCLTLCDPTDCSTPGLPVPHHLPEFAQVHVCWISDAIQPSHSLNQPFSSCLQSFPASGSFPMSQLFSSGGLNIGASASASVLPMSIQG